MTPDQYCQEKAAASGSSFYYSFMFLPMDKREAITALYAFCREVDDIADECTDFSIAQTKLNWWRTEIESLYQGKPQHPVSKALVQPIKTHHLEAKHFIEIIDGMEMDLVHHRYADFDALRLYCHRAAGVVGQLSASIFGYANPSTLEYAEALGIAFQLTNIIRDVGEDSRRGRVYLPADELARFGLSADDVLERRGGEAFTKLMEFQADRARSFYDLAYSKLAPEDRSSQRAGLIMAAIYRTLLEEIERDGFQVLDRRVALTPLRKLWIAWRTWMKIR